MKKLSKKIVVNIVLALILVAVFATTAFAVDSASAFITPCTGAKTVSTAEVGPSDIDNNKYCKGMGYNNITSEPGSVLLCEFWVSNSSGLGYIRRHYGLISPGNFYGPTLLPGYKYSYTKLKKGSDQPYNVAGGAWAYANVTS